MSAQFCVGCGAPLAPGAKFCASCGTPVAAAAAPSPPLVSSPPPGYSSSGATTPVGGFPPVGSPDGPSPPRKHWSTARKVVVIIVVAILVISVIAVVAIVTAPPQVSVDIINIWAPDNVCGLNTNPIGYDGFNTSPSQSYGIALGVPNYNNTSCDLLGVVANTSGFTVTQASVPLSIPGLDTSEGGNLSLTIKLPGSAFSGDLNLVFR